MMYNFIAFSITFSYADTNCVKIDRQKIDRQRHGQIARPIIGTVDMGSLLFLS